jgi:hypothetical protein
MRWQVWSLGFAVLFQGCAVRAPGNVDSEVLEGNHRQKLRANERWTLAVTVNTNDDLRLIDPAGRSSIDLSEANRIPGCLWLRGWMGPNQLQVPDPLWGTYLLEIKTSTATRLTVESALVGRPRGCQASGGINARGEECLQWKFTVVHGGGDSSCVISAGEVVRRNPCGDEW